MKKGKLTLGSIIILIVVLSLSLVMRPIIPEVYASGQTASGQITPPPTTPPTNPPTIPPTVDPVCIVGTGPDNDKDKVCANPDESGRFDCDDNDNAVSIVPIVTGIISISYDSAYVDQTKRERNFDLTKRNSAPKLDNAITPYDELTIVITARCNMNQELAIGPVPTTFLINDTPIGRNLGNILPDSVYFPNVYGGFFGFQFAGGDRLPDRVKPEVYYASLPHQLDYYSVSGANVAQPFYEPNPHPWIQDEDFTNRIVDAISKKIQVGIRLYNYDLNTNYYESAKYFTEFNEAGFYWPVSSAILPITNCLQMYGDGEHQLIQVRGKSVAKIYLEKSLGAITIQDMLNFANDLRIKGIEGIDPFKTYKTKFSSFVDLKVMDDTGWKVDNSLFANHFSIDSINVPANSSCKFDNYPSPNGAKYFFYDNRTHSYTSEYTNVTWLTNGGYTNYNYHTIFLYPYKYSPYINMHEYGHAFCNLQDEYIYVSRDYTDWDRGFRNCAQNPFYDYLYANKIYGDSVPPMMGCGSYTRIYNDYEDYPVYRPSRNSLMNKFTEKEQRRLNIISCGYCLSSIIGGYAESFWPTCEGMNTVQVEYGCNTWEDCDPFQKGYSGCFRCDTTEESPTIKTCIRDNIYPNGVCGRPHLPTDRENFNFLAGYCDNWGFCEDRREGECFLDSQCPAGMKCFNFECKYKP